VVQQKINVRIAQIEAVAAGQFRDAIGEATGRGVGGISPALEAKRFEIHSKKISDQGSSMAKVLSDSAELSSKASSRQYTSAVTVAEATAKAAIEAEKNAIRRQVGLLDQAAQMVTGA
jgi:hypothetical protein